MFSQQKLDDNFISFLVILGFVCMECMFYFPVEVEWEWRKNVLLFGSTEQPCVVSLWWWWVVWCRYLFGGKQNTSTHTQYRIINRQQHTKIIFIIRNMSGEEGKIYFLRILCEKQRGIYPFYTVIYMYVYIVWCEFLFFRYMIYEMW